MAKKILVINCCEECHYYHQNDYWHSTCIESQRKQIEDNGYGIIKDGNIIDPGCQLEDAKE